MIEIEDRLLLEKHWKELLPLDKQHYRNEFLMSFKPMSLHHDYYSCLSLDQIINDSLFMNYIATVFTPILMLKKMQGRDYKPDNLDCEPDELFQKRLEEIKAMQHG